MQATRALLGLVIVMGVLIVVGTAGLIGVIAHRIAHPRPIAETLDAPAIPAGPMLAREPAGTRITAIARQSDTRLAIALTGGGPDRVLVWDLAASRALAEIRLGP